MAYNPNETVKLKHLNEFATQLANKIDGKTGVTRPITELTYNYSGSNSIAVPSKFIINIPSSDSLKWLTFKFKTTADSAPQILNLSDNAEDYKIGLTDMTYGGEYGWNGSKGYWAVNISSSSDNTQRIIITPRQLKFTLHFDATPNYDAYNQEFTVNITAS